MEEYGHGKQQEVRAHIRRLCKTNFSFYVGQPKTYTASERCHVDAEVVLRVEREVFDHVLSTMEHANVRPEESLPKASQVAILQDLERVCKYLRAQPTQTVRDKYRKVIGFGPQIILQHEKSEPGARQLDILSERVRKLVTAMGECRGAGTSLSAHEFLAYAGDVVVVKADLEWFEEESQLNTDPLSYWLFELLEPIKVKTTAMSFCEGVWFEVEKIDTEGTRWYRHGDSQRIRYGKLCVDDADEVIVLPWDMIETTIGEEGVTLYGVKDEFSDMVAEIEQKRMEAQALSASAIQCMAGSETDVGGDSAGMTNDTADSDESVRLKDILDAGNASCSGSRKRRIKKPDGSDALAYKDLLK